MCKDEWHFLPGSASACLAKLQGELLPQWGAGGFTSVIGRAVLLSGNRQRNKAEGLTHLPAVLEVPWFLLLHPYGFPSLWTQLQQHHCTR